MGEQREYIDWRRNASWKDDYGVEYQSPKDHADDNAMKRGHRRAWSNDGFAKILMELDEKLQGKVSMVWQQRKPMMKICPICGKNVGLSSSSLKLHLQNSHRRLSSGSVDSGMKMEIEKALTALKITRGGSVGPTQRQSHSLITDE